MADYKELLRRAVQALPENNGAARRAVYEKARAALVGQLRAINPPLPARDITTHRLQLEDCIRQVEQEASEAVIAGMQEPSPPPPRLQTTQPPKLEVRPEGRARPTPVEPLPAIPEGPDPGTIEAIIAAAEEAASREPPKQPSKALAAVRSGRNTKVPPKKEALPPEPESEDAPVEEAEEVVAEAAPAKPAKPNGKAGRQLPAIVARAEAAKKGGGSAFTLQAEKTYESGRRGPVIEPRRDGVQRLEPAANRESVPRLEQTLRLQAATARQRAIEPDPEPRELPEPEVEQTKVAAAMFAVREVDNEPNIPDPQGAIDRAIATLDREARGEIAAEDDAGAQLESNVVELPRPEKALPERVAAERKRGLGRVFRDRGAVAERTETTRPPVERPEKKVVPPARARGRAQRATEGEVTFQRAQADHERGGVSAVTIFLTVFAILLVGAGGTGFWAWREGFLNLDAMFAGTSAPVTQQTAEPPADLTAVASNPEALAASTPGNTVTAEPALTPPEPQRTEDRLTPEGPAVASTQPLALVPANEPAADERLPVEGAAAGATPNEAVAAIQSVDPANIAGSQSLLLEAADNGATGAIPFSGTVDWSKGTDETGAATLVGKASIPARNLTVDLILRRNADSTLPASHLMEISFGVTETFVGGSVAHLPGVLLKTQELVQGTPLIGASARVFGNSFLFALSASPGDSATNSELLKTRKWIDLAIIYATGKRAIITLEKDEAAEALFLEVFDSWSRTASN